MSESQSNKTNECKCLGSKELKALKKQIAELKSEIAELHKQIATLRKAVRK